MTDTTQPGLPGLSHSTVSRSTVPKRTLQKRRDAAAAEAARTADGETAQTIIAAWIDYIRSVDGDLPSTMIKRVAREVGVLIRDQPSTQSTPIKWALLIYTARCLETGRLLPTDDIPVLVLKQQVDASPRGRAWLDQMKANATATLQGPRRLTNAEASRAAQQQYRQRRRAQGATDV